MSDWLTKLREERYALRALYQKVASTLLAPDGALVRWQECHVSTESGCVTRDESGRYIIDISPSLPPDECYKVFLHECAHALDTSHAIKRSHYYRLQPGGAKALSCDAERISEPTRKRLEVTADVISGELTSYANTHAYEHLRADEPVLYARLRSLAEPQARYYMKSFTSSFTSEIARWRRDEQKAA